MSNRNQIPFNLKLFVYHPCREEPKYRADGRCVPLNKQNVDCVFFCTLNFSYAEKQHWKIPAPPIPTHPHKEIKITTACHKDTPLHDR